MKSLEQRIEEAVREEIEIVPYAREWPASFEREAAFLRSALPKSILGGIEHFGSTAIPGLSAKPIIDILVEVSSLEKTKKQIVPLLEEAGYDYFWRTDTQPAYAWFIKRDPQGKRTHHLHMVEADSVLWDRLYFRDYLRKFRDERIRYEQLKKALAEKHRNDRVSYTEGKTEFIVAITEKAKRYFKAGWDGINTGFLGGIMADLSYPNETNSYRDARDELLKAEIELRAQVERVAAMRRGLPLGGAVKQDYEFEEIDTGGNIRSVRLSELFGDSKDTLFLYSLMYGPSMANPCPMCGSIVDGLNGNAPQITQRISLAVVARSPIERIAVFAKARGWNNVRLLSSAKNSYNADYFGETPEGDQYPMGNVFVRRDGSIYHSWGTEMLYAGLEGDPRHMDMMWPLWNVLDTTPDGRGNDWYPRLHG